MYAKVKSVAVRHIGVTLPSKTIENSQNEFFDENTVRKVIANTGIETRHVLSEAESLADLYCTAAEDTLRITNWPKESIDAIVVVSQTREYLLPATACILQNRLGFSKETAALDISLGCSGYIYGLYSAMSMISGSGGGVKRVLLFVGDAVSTLSHPKDKTTAFLFSDAASCTALEYDDGYASEFLLKTDGSGAEQIMVPASGLAGRNFKDVNLELEGSDGSVRTRASLHLNGTAVFDFTVREVPKLISESLEKAGISLDEAGVFCLHQANKFMLNFIGKKSRILDKMPIHIEKYGNSSGVSIPLLIADMPQHCLKSHAVLVGFGVGWSMGSAIVDLKNVTTSLSGVTTS